MHAHSDCQVAVREVMLLDGQGLGELSGLGVILLGVILLGHALCGLLLVLGGVGFLCALGVLDGGTVCAAGRQQQHQGGAQC
ncbi:hypothetical protein GCM10027061_19250 [Nesterenkonia suensis]